MDEDDNDGIIVPHGGYRELKSFQLAQLVYDVTAQFCHRYIEADSRTHDQMVQAARSGVQNIAEGSAASGTSKKFELKLTNVARASLEELRLDYEDFLRQRGLAQWPPDHPALERFKARRCATLDEVRAWVRDERQRRREDRGVHDSDATPAGTRTGTRTDTDGHGRTRTPPKTTDSGTGSEGPARVGQCKPVSGPCSEPSEPPSSAQLAANGALSLLNLCCYLLDRQVEALAKAFKEEGGFTERLYKARRSHRRQQ